jgi:hypothetical protein
VTTLRSGNFQPLIEETTAALVIADDGTPGRVGSGWHFSPRYLQGENIQLMTPGTVHA